MKANLNDFDASLKTRRVERQIDRLKIVSECQRCIPIGDAMIAGFCVHDELAAMVAGGMTPLAALQTATVNPARYLGRESTLGTVAAGRQADLVLLGLSSGTTAPCPRAC